MSNVDPALKTVASGNRTSRHVPAWAVVGTAVGLMVAASACAGNSDPLGPNRAQASSAAPATPSEVPLGATSSAAPSEAPHAAPPSPSHSTEAPQASAAPSDAAPSPSRTCAPANVAVHAAPGTFTFDMRCGGSSVIDVYPGTGTSGYDTQSTGTFSDRQVVEALCQTTGRTVHIQSYEVGSGSDQWTEITAGGREYFASDTYGEVTGTLPPCSTNELP